MQLPGAQIGRQRALMIPRSTAPPLAEYMIPLDADALAFLRGLLCGGVGGGKA